jgi:hypothetical protein
MATVQQGRVARRQLLAAGIGRGSIDWRVQIGRLIVEHPGVYAVAHVAPTRFGRVMSAILAAGEDAVASHRTAAWIHGIIPPPSRRIDIAVRGGGSHVIAGAVVHRLRSLRPTDVESVQGVPVTSLARTIVDLAGVARPAQLRRAIKQAEVDQRLDVGAIQDVLAHVARPRGVTALRQVLSQVIPFTRSGLEVAFLELVSAAGIPMPETNVDVWVAPGHAVEVDALWRAAGLAVEVDGGNVHSGELARHDDARKGELLAGVGLRLFRAGEWRIRYAPEDVVTNLRRALAASTVGSATTASVDPTLDRAGAGAAADAADARSPAP